MTDPSYQSEMGAMLDLVLEQQHDVIRRNLAHTPISADVCAYVLRYFGHPLGTWGAGSFYGKLIDATANADTANRARIGAGFPEVALAVDVIKELPEGVRELQAVIGLQRCPDCDRGRVVIGRDTEDRPITGGCASCEGHGTIRFRPTVGQHVRWRAADGTYCDGWINGIDQAAGVARIISSDIAEIDLGLLEPLP